MIFDMLRCRHIKVDKPNPLKPIMAAAGGGCCSHKLLAPRKYQPPVSLRSSLKSKKQQQQQQSGSFTVMMPVGGGISGANKPKAGKAIISKLKQIFALKPSSKDPTNNGFRKTPLPPPMKSKKPGILQ